MKATDQVQDHSLYVRRLLVSVGLVGLLAGAVAIFGNLRLAPLAAWFFPLILLDNLGWRGAFSLPPELLGLLTVVVLSWAARSRVAATACTVWFFLNSAVGLWAVIGLSDYL